MAGRKKSTAAESEPKAEKKAKTETAAPAAKTSRTRKQTIKLELTNEQAQNASTVTVAGEFNNWDKEATPLTKTLNGFEVELKLEKGKSYQFRYVLDGTTWINDPYRTTIDNGLGELNSVIEA